MMENSLFHRIIKGLIEECMKVIGISIRIFHFDEEVRNMQLVDGQKSSYRLDPLLPLVNTHKGRLDNSYSHCNLAVL